MRKAASAMSSLEKRETGSIKWYNHTKRYGFIRPDSCPGSADLFFHATKFVPSWECYNLLPGDDVEYSVETDEIGRPRAVHVTRRKGTHFACGKEDHHVIDTPQGQSVTDNSHGKRGHTARSWGRKCFDCGQVGHIAVHCPSRQASSSLWNSDVGLRQASSSLWGSDVGDESSEEQLHRGGPGGDGAAGTDDENDDDDDDDDDDCVILENNPFVRRETQVWGKLFQNLVDEFSDIPSERICKREVDTDEEEETYDCVPLENKQHDGESDDDCIVLEKPPFEEDVHETIINMSSKLCLSSNVGTLLSVQQPSDSELKSLEGLDHDELIIVAEKGQVACRDYPHSRHLCVKYPFKDTPHHTCCNLCYCYVCDIKAPCKYWETENDGHCHASEQEFKWIAMRVLNRTKCA